MICAVAGGKGGVGKSTVSLELGAAIGAVVVDGDLAMADLPSGRGPDLHDVLAGVAAPREAVRSLGEFAVVPCGRTLAGVGAADVTRLAGVLETLSADRPVVVDCPAGMAADAGVALAAADRCVLVTTPSPAAQVDALRTRELARVLDAGVARVVCNRQNSARGAADAARRLGIPTVGLPESRALGATLETGEPVVSRAPDGAVAGRVADLARSVTAVG